MALSGTSGAYYRSGSMIPSGAGMHSAYTRHLWVRAGSVPSNANYRCAASQVGNSQNPHDQLWWNRVEAGLNKSSSHRSAAGSYSFLQFVSSLPANTWIGLGTVYTGSNLTCYLNGVSDSTVGGLSIAASSAIYCDVLAAITYAGALDASSQWADGQVAELGLWNAALSADEMSSLGKGFRPSRIRPQSLQLYMPGVGSLTEVRGGRTFVRQAGSDVFSAHPPVR